MLKCVRTIERAIFCLVWDGKMSVQRIPVVKTVSTVITMLSHVGNVSGDGEVRISNTTSIQVLADRSSTAWRNFVFRYAGYIADDAMNPSTGGENLLYATSQGWTFWRNRVQYIILDDSRQLLDKYGGVGRLVSRVNNSYWDLTLNPPAKFRTKEKYFIPREEYVDVIIADSVVFDNYRWITNTPYLGIEDLDNMIKVFDHFGFVNLVVFDTDNVFRLPLEAKTEAVYVFVSDYKALEITRDDQLDDIQIPEPEENFFLTYSKTSSAIEVLLRLFLNSAKIELDSIRDKILVNESAGKIRADREMALLNYTNDPSDANKKNLNAIERKLRLLRILRPLIEQSGIPTTLRIAIRNYGNVERAGMSKVLMTAKKPLALEEIDVVGVDIDKLSSRSLYAFPSVSKPLTLPVLSQDAFHEQIVLFVQRYEEIMATNKAVIMGSAAAYLLTTKLKPETIQTAHLPNDVDIWFYDKNDFSESQAYISPEKREPLLKELLADDWKIESFTRPFSDKISKNIRSITQLSKLGYAFKLQVIGIVVDPHVMVDEFDLSVAKVIYNPMIVKTKVNAFREQEIVVGFKQTERDVIDDVLKKRAVFLERTWDIEAKGTASAGLTLTKRSISRLVKYVNKGYQIVASPKSRFTTAELDAYIAEEIRAKNDKTRIGRDRDNDEYEGFYYIEFPAKIADFFGELINIVFEDYTSENVPYVSYQTKQLLILQVALKDLIKKHGDLLGISILYPNSEINLRTEWTTPILRNDLD